jgi:hypothetical protein
MKRRTLWMMSLIATLIVALTVPVTASAATSYTYGKVTASNGVVLHYMKGSPNSIKLKKISSTLANQTNYGINGGFFTFGTGDMLSIAVHNDVPVGGGSMGELNKGAVNVGYARGTLVWDAAAGKYSVQVLKWAKDLTVTSRSNYWAQGGISMGLNNESGWKAQATAENLSHSSSSGRSGIVYNSANNIWLVVTDTTCTPEQFRAAIKGSIGSGTLVNGIFLDGSGSSQMRALSTAGSLINVKGDSRTVYQMVAFE